MTNFPLIGSARTIQPQLRHIIYYRTTNVETDRSYSAHNILRFYFVFFLTWLSFKGSETSK
jgi:hypothetical protein